MGLLCWCIDQLHILDNVHLYLLSCYHNRVMAVMAGFQGYMSITRIKSVIWYGAVMVYKKYFQKAHNALAHPLCTDNCILKLSSIICDRITTLVCCFADYFSCPNTPPWSCDMNLDQKLSTESPHIDRKYVSVASICTLKNKKDVYLWIYYVFFCVYFWLGSCDLEYTDGYLCCSSKSTALSCGMLLFIWLPHCLAANMGVRPA